ncbi:SDR family oxidoreductase [Streptomyces sp. VRA16 Mangrove soil]|uniref:SDR family oxidoreductase n=1 Tax=Streptomyces sp. VRA16 Mangrove soil TaxID=2817434 RepID=UPI001E3C5E2C|nr:NmrA family NAD(P)-binding protein [Streptomyces sp. VRA16 Mangrove soil]
MTTVLVTGATGAVGRHLVRELLDSGAEVRALTRDAERARSVLPDGAEPVVGDLADADTLARALKGADRAYVMLDADAGAAFADAASRAAGLRHVVLLSASAAADPGYDNPMFRKHVRGEQHLRASGVPTTFLRPGAFHTLALHWVPAVRGDGVVRVVFPHLSVALIDPRDIADVAAVALRGDVERWAGRELLLSGPQLLDMRDRARIIAETVGRPLRVEQVPEEAWVRAASAHLPEPYARALVGVERYFTERPPGVVGTVAEVTGHPARSFRSWVEDHRHAFLG